MQSKRVLLSEKEMPSAWYNLQADLPQPLPPPLDPATNRPMDPAKLERVFARALLQQEMSRERWIEIPEEIRRVYAIWRPSPLVRATNLERALETPARIYFKDESHSPPGSHKPNTAVPQAYYNKIEGIQRLTTETGAGQWGAALAFACKMFDIKCKVFMVKVSYHQKPYRRMMMHIWGGEVTASPSTETAGRPRPSWPRTPTAPAAWASPSARPSSRPSPTTAPATRWAACSTTSCCTRPSSAWRRRSSSSWSTTSPTWSSAAWAAAAISPAWPSPSCATSSQGREIRFVACEPHCCPSMSRGQYRYDFGDTTKLTPLIKMYTLGHSFMPPGIHAGGLRYHGMAPDGQPGASSWAWSRPQAFHQIECFEAARLFAATEGTIPAPETSHAIRARDRRGPALQGDRPGKVHPLQLQRPRPVRHGLLREVLRRPPGGLRLSAGEDRARPWPSCRWWVSPPCASFAVRSSAGCSLMVAPGGRRRSGVIPRGVVDRKG